MKSIVLGKKVVSRTETVRDWVEKSGHKDCVIGISAFYGVWAYLIRLLRIRKRFIYYCIDFYSYDIAWGWPDKVFIWLHIRVDRFLTFRADENWIISTRILLARDIPSPHFTIVPLGYPKSYFRDEKFHYDSIVYVGLKPYGLELARKVVPKHKLTILTSGKLPLKRLLNIVSHSGIGLALWEKKGNQYYGDSGKIKLYLVCGIPVIVTSNANFSEVVEREQAGVVIDFNEQSLRLAIKKIENNYEFYRKNAVRIGHEYCDSERIFNESQRFTPH